MSLAIFRWLWIAGLASNAGTWMHEVGAGWLMKQLSTGNPLMVALVQAAGTLPMFLLSVPAGALADVGDRRRIILACQLVSLVVAALLAVVTEFGAVTPSLLVLATLALGASAAIANPAWQTAMTDLVPREQLPAAASLNSVSINLSRAIGPTIGGFLVGAAGPQAAFALNAVSFVGVSIVLWRWKPKRKSQSSLAERFFGALRAGYRYVRHSEPMHAVLVRTASFVLFASALWALMPLVASTHLSLSASGYGALLGCLGAGAVTMGLLLPRVRAAIGPNRLVVVASVMMASVMALLALMPVAAVGYAVFLVYGGAWITLVTSCNIAAQAGVPAWVRGRALAWYLSVFFLSMTIGSLLWGEVARQSSITTALLAAASGLVLGLATIARYAFKTPAGEALQFSDSWADPVVNGEIDPDDGPVVVTIEYRVRTTDADAFRRAMEPVSVTRYRDGAISWMLTRDTEDTETWLEVFVVESWAEHLRQHDRVTKADEELQSLARGFHQPLHGEGPRPKVRHFVAARHGIAAPPAPTPHGHQD